MACDTDLPALLSRARAHDRDAVEALARLVEGQLSPTVPRPRGGDQRAAERARRDEALHRLAAMVGAGMPGERLARVLGPPLARVLATRLARFRPMPTETAPDRVLMREIVTSGMPLPGPDRLARILRAR